MMVRGKYEIRTKTAVNRTIPGLIEDFKYLGSHVSSVEVSKAI
jgi:hypothetical protein